jgi:hypothetical protein
MTLLVLDRRTIVYKKWFMLLYLWLVGCAACPLGAGGARVASSDYIEIPAEALEDKIRGGLLAQLLGNLNGLPHENKYYDTPGNVTQYTPGLPNGARTDDDTDIEWVYILAMQQNRTTMLGPEQITGLWKKHINTHIWCSNLYVRRLMDIGLDPPLTGSLVLNPWANFNISGQFVCESFGLIAPAMPQSAARIGLHYTHVSIDGEPAQATQLFTSMIATAFVNDDIDVVLDAGVASIDPKSALVPIISDVRRWHRENPTDWRMTRRLVKEKYTLYESRTRNQNGYELCTAATVAALLYGDGDLVNTLIHAFNFGWDADNNAATAATIVGVIKGHRWMQRQGWQIKDRYRNTTRPSMPEDETITRFGDRIIDVARQVIVDNEGKTVRSDGRTYYRIHVQKPANVESLADLEEQLIWLRSEMKPCIEAGLADGAAVVARARAAYLAICLDLAGSVRSRQPDKWTGLLASLERYPELIGVLFYQSPGPAGDRLRDAALAAGLTKPPR